MWFQILNRSKKTSKIESTFIEISNEYECLTLDIKALDGLVMGYYHGNRVTALWQYERTRSFSNESADLNL